MKCKLIILAALLGICVVAHAQVVFTSKSYFPAEGEFIELQKIISEDAFEDPNRLSKIADGDLIQAVGFDRYARRNYSLGDRKEISIEIFTLQDSRAAYSLLTLLCKAPLLTNRPGDFHTMESGKFCFAQGRLWIRLQSSASVDELLKRVALSISNRIGATKETLPALISHLPEKGLDVGSLRYFPSLASYKIFAGVAAAESLNLVSDVEIAQARYATNSQWGFLLLLCFPTGQVADDYFAAVGHSAIAPDGPHYVRKVGPLVAILTGPVNPSSADSLLRSIRYSYSIRWIFEKKNQTKIVWGIPVSILGTVVRSMFFIAILALVSILAGAATAFLRFFIKNRFSSSKTEQQDEADIVKLRLR